MPTFWADVSQWNAVVDDSYPYPILAARLDNGSSGDSHALTNWRWARTSAACKAFIGYVVFKPGALDGVLARVKAVLGPNPPKAVLMIDMESGGQFAGPGNHSTEANRWADAFAAYLGDARRVIGYANGGDWASCWPSRPAWLKRITAAYSTHDPGGFGWQYYGGETRYAFPPGYPSSCPPFGANVDMNASQLPLDAVLEAFGLTGDDMSAAEVADIKAAIETARANLHDTIVAETRNAAARVTASGADDATAAQLANAMKSLPAAQLSLTPDQLTALAAHLAGLGFTVTSTVTPK
jgi:hypothetical protein